MTRPWCLPITPAPTRANFRVIPLSPFACTPSRVLDSFGGEQVGEGLPGAAEQIRPGEPAGRRGRAQMRLEREEPVEPVVSQRPHGPGDLAVAVTRGHHRA